MSDKAGISSVATIRAVDARSPALAVQVWQASATGMVVVSPTHTESLCSQIGEIHRIVERYLPEHGAVLLRGFSKPEVSGFHDFATSFGHQLLAYDFASTPRSRMGDGVYSSTEYPAHQWIPQHNEQSYTLRWPLKIWFYCDVPARQGGETPISDSRVLHRRIDPTIRRRFAEKHLMYVRNYDDGLDVPWEQVFRTSNRADVEAFCRSQQIAYEWLDSGALRTRQVCQSEATHPRTGDVVWFNQAHLFHISSLPPALREALLAAVAEEHLPRNVYYGDGTPIEDGVLDEIRGIYRESMMSFAWCEGDILMLDNMLIAHGRAPFAAPRRVLVAMAEPWGGGVVAVGPPGLKTHSFESGAKSDA
jgi:alpha-ketoglutarate-dependent taurine dioxygenase